MSSRKNWPLAVSVNFSVVTDDSKLDELRAAGISQIELSSGDIRPFFDNNYFERSVDIFENAKAHGIEISSIHLPFSPFNLIDGAYASNFAVTLRLQSMILEAAAVSGIKIAVIHPSGEPYSEEERPARLAEGCKLISALTDKAKELGVQLALENLPRTCLCRTHDEMEYFLRHIPELKVCFDTNHNLSEDNSEYISAIGDKIITLHVSDYDFIDERHWLPGRGKNDWQKIIETLENVGYEGRFLYEVGWKDVSYKDVAENYAKLLG